MIDFVTNRRVILGENSINEIPSVLDWYDVYKRQDVMECLRKRDAKAAIQSLKKSNEYNYARLGEFFLSKDGPDGAGKGELFCNITCMTCYIVCIK